MERRVVYAILLMMAVAILPSVLWPPKRAERRSGGPADSAAVAAQPAAPAPAPAPATPPAAPPQARPAARADTIWVTAPLYRYGFTTAGGSLVAAELTGFRSFAPGDSASPVQLVPVDRPLLEHRLVAGADTADLTSWTFTPSVSRLTVEPGATPASFTLSADRGGARVTLTYTFRPDEYLFDVRGEVAGLGPGGAVLALGMGDGLRSVEVDTAGDFRLLAVVTKAAKTQSHGFGSFDPGEVQRVDGPFEWVGIKSKYFLVAALATGPNDPAFGGAVLRGGPRSGRVATRTAVDLTLPVPAAGGWRYQVYAGPIEHARLARIGHGLDDANPYGWFLRPIIHPVSLFVVNILLWMHERLNLAYGWVLVIFGVAVRLLLWPLNQKAMESSLRMQAVAPLMKEVQERYKGEPERLQREMMKLYREHNVNPFGGCLPMLLPLPVLFALFFVFANTIEFRGVPFLWLPDLSRQDPLYIIPVVMGLSMFTVSKIGQIGVPPNPQTKLMLYFLPVMMTVLFLNFASGLNLYYTVQNIVSLPQQYLLARRRLRETGKSAKPGGT